MAMDQDELVAMLQRVHASADRDLPWARPMNEMWKRYNEKNRKGGMMGMIEMLGLSIALGAGKEATQTFMDTLRESGYRAGFVDGQAYGLIDVAQEMARSKPEDEEVKEAIIGIKLDLAKSGFNVEEMFGGLGIARQKQQGHSDKLPTAASVPPGVKG